MRINKDFIKNHSRCIKNQAIKELGETEIFAFARYILPDGGMLNFSYGGNQRDEDHRIIGQFFKKCSGTETMLEMMKRGSVRVSCNFSTLYRGSYCFEFIGELTSGQEDLIREAFKEAYDSESEFYLEVDRRNGKRVRSFSDWFEYCEWKEGIAA